MNGFISISSKAKLLKTSLHCLELVESFLHIFNSSPLGRLWFIYSQWRNWLSSIYLICFLAIFCLLFPLLFSSYLQQNFPAIIIHNCKFHSHLFWSFCHGIFLLFQIIITWTFIFSIFYPGLCSIFAILRLLKGPFYNYLLLKNVQKTHFIKVNMSSEILNVISRRQSIYYWQLIVILMIG